MNSQKLIPGFDDERIGMFSVRSAGETDEEGEPDIRDFAEEEVASEIELFLRCTARRTEVDDVPAIKALEKRWTAKLFGETNGYEMLENAVLAVTLESSNGTLVAHGAFCDYPQASILQPTELEMWLAEHCGPEVNSLNVVFLQHFVSLKSILRKCLHEITKTLFKTLTWIDHALIIIPSSVSGADNLKSVYSTVCHKSVSDFYSVHMCSRKDIWPPLRIRAARVEDNDRLMKLFGNQAEVLRRYYGNYFLAELIEQQQQLDTCLIAENIEKEVIGFMSISKNVELSLLEKHFQLTPFNGFKKLYRPKLEEAKQTKLEGIGARLGPGAAKQKTPGVGLKKMATTPEKTPSIMTLTHSEEMTSGTQSSTPSQSRGFTVEQQESVFCIHIYLLREDYETNYMSFLEAAFRVYEDKEFCVISIPTWSTTPPLIERFSRVSPVSNSPFPQELFVFHRWAMLSKNFKIRRAMKRDSDGVTNLLENIEGNKTIQGDFVRACEFHCDQDSNQMMAFVAECQQQIAGLAILCNEFEIDYIRSNFNIEDYIYFGLHGTDSHVRLLHFIMHPIFNHWNRLFLKEIMRIGGKTCIYLRLYNNPEQSAQFHTMSVASEFISVPPRKNIAYSEEVLNCNVPSKKCLESKERDFLLSLISRKHVMELKMLVRTIIVIVGASETAFAVIKTLLDRPFVNHTNLYLVSTTGVTEDNSVHNILRIIHPESLSNPLNDMNSSYIHSRVSLVKGFMTSINRNKKNITINRQFQIPYDFLLLCCGKQYQKLNAFMDLFEENVRITNVYVVNNKKDSLKLMSDINNYYTTVEDEQNIFRNIIIYGNNLRAYTFLEALLEAEVPTKYIVLVEPVPIFENFCLHGEVLPEILQIHLEELNVRHLREFNLQSTSIKYEGSEITDVTFESKYGPTIELNVKFFVCFSEKRVDRQTFLAINDASIVYDGGLVIDEEFRTNDPWIFAAGPMTKFSRRYYTSLSPHPVQINSAKSGKLLALHISQSVNPLCDGSPNEIYKNPAILMQNLIGPVIMSGQFPREMFYFHMCNTGQCMDCPVQEARGNAFILETGSAFLSDIPYVRLFFNNNGRLDSITCISYPEHNVKNEVWVKIFGYHKEFFNSLVSKFDEGLIQDLYSYFLEPWSYAILLDRFPEYWKETKKMLYDKLAALPEIKKRIEKAFINNTSLDWHDTNKTKRALKKVTKTKISNLLICFLHYNESLLPMYALPDII